MSKQYLIGIDLGGTNIAAGVVDRSGNIIAKHSRPTLAQREYPEIIADMAAAAREACAKANISIEDVQGIGIGSPGTADNKNGVLVYANNLNFKNVPMRTEMQKHINLPVYISNDANCAALGETADIGAAKGLRNVIMITLGTGLGGGIIIDGKIYEGEYGAGAELGHNVMVVDGIPCTCGRHGCWETYSSATGLIRMTRDELENSPESVMWGMINGNLENISGRTAFEASRKGDAAGQRVVDKYIKFLSEGIINMMNIFRPEIFLIGGGVCNEGDYLFKPLREYIGKNLYGGDLIPAPPIQRASLGNDAGIIGAAMLVIKN